ncbi:hypothetical protein M422DRAFT_269627 [Sphaerobolus stellatus SS14]|uniref:DEAD-box helicase OB fold domain-containing protein n=1 Tax=Sphaerobolus stellatus (strain SS14) TaxID=990650 RepID=A0A0C9UUL3_SPHS4|nr:hypothetical protein M422DRAFT_269627 [Sphaerobolus stellatus SS14]
MTYLNVIRSYNEIAEQETAARRKHWCRTHFVNERTVRETSDIFEQLKRVCNTMGIDLKVSAGDVAESILKSVLRGLYQNAALLHPDVKIHHSSSLSSRKAPCIFFEEFVFTTQTYVRGVSSIAVTAVAELPSYQIRAA